MTPETKALLIVGDGCSVTGTASPSAAFPVTSQLDCEPSDGEAVTAWEQRYDELHKPGQPMPGPWTWEIHDHSMATLCGGGEDAIVGHIMDVGPCKACSERHAATGWQWGGCGSPGLDNAQLIAAAPDLLEALKQAQAVMAMLTVPDVIGQTTTLNAWAACVSAEAAARAAIAKALSAEPSNASLSLVNAGASPSERTKPPHTIGGETPANPRKAQGEQG